MDVSKAVKLAASMDEGRAAKRDTFSAVLMVVGRDDLWVALKDSMKVDQTAAL